MKAPTPEQVAAAVRAWSEQARLVPADFLRAAAFGAPQPAHRVEVEYAGESRTWALTNREYLPEAWEVKVPDEPREGTFQLRLEGSQRESSCPDCGGAGKPACGTCLMLGRVQCRLCRGNGCNVCRGGGAVPCPDCSRGGTSACTLCQGTGRAVLANVLEVTRWCRSKEAVSPLPPFPTPAAATTLGKLSVADPAAKLHALAFVPGMLKGIVAAMERELAPAPGERLRCRRLTIEELPLWRVPWTYGGQQGEVWLDGMPPRAYFPHPPRLFSRRVLHLGAAVLGTLALLFLVTLLTSSGERPAPTPPKAGAPPAAPFDSAAAVSEDALVFTADGRVLRGALRGTAEGFKVGDVALESWQVVALHDPAAPAVAAFLEEIAGVESAAAHAERGRLVAALLEAYRHEERWTALEPLCRPGELPPGPRPVARLREVKKRIEARLDAPATPAVPTPAPVPTTPAPAPGPAVSEGMPEALAALRPRSDEALGAKFRAWAAQPRPCRDLLAAAGLCLSRPERDWQLVTDALVVETPRVKSRHEGVVDVSTATLIHLRLANGTTATAVRRADEGWKVTLPGGAVFEGASCAVEKNVPTVAKTLLAGHFEAFPPAGWPSAPAVAHLEAGRWLAASLRGETAPPPRGALLLRTFAAGHAAAALHAGGPAEIVDALQLLQKLGYKSCGPGSWHDPADAAAFRTGALLRELRTEEARAHWAQAKGEAGFGARYAAAAARLLHPIASAAEAEGAIEALDRCLALARVESEHRHLQALREALTGARPCAACRGAGVQPCSSCKATGKRSLTCGRCNGKGYVLLVGAGGGPATCPSCRGKPNVSDALCAKCRGEGRVDCASCEAPFRVRTVEEICRTRPCAFCAGEGTLGDAILFACPACAGLGLQLVPAGRPAATLR